MNGFSASAKCDPVSGRPCSYLRPLKPLFCECGRNARFIKVDSSGGEHGPICLLCGFSWVAEMRQHEGEEVMGT